MNLQQENNQLKEQLQEQIDYKEEYYHYWQETKKELAIREKALKLACQFHFPSESAFDYFIEQAKEIMK